MKAVFDTNILIDAINDNYSFQARLIEAVLDKKLSAVKTDAVEREYRNIMNRLIEDNAFYDKLEQFIDIAETVQEERVDVAIEDREDLKLIQAAVGGKADFVVTKDHHLLDIGEYENIRMILPEQAWSIFTDEEEPDGAWQKWQDLLGLK